MIHFILHGTIFVVFLALFMRARRKSTNERLVVGFIHPDLGIGGAERLVVDAAVALQNKGHVVRMFTAHHDPSHCFPETKSELSVQVYGDWMPRSICGRFYALFAYVRMAWVALVMAFWSPPCDVIFCDQVSACIPILQLTRARVLFYCHFPDLLLAQRPSLLKKLYRYPLDKLEEYTTGMANIVLVNSKFTRGVYFDTFKALRRQREPQVLYPCVTIQSQANLQAEEMDENFPLPEGAFVSINRFERKKNVSLGLEAYIELQGMERGTAPMPRLVFAGGYDPNNVENKEYLDELVARVIEMQLKYCIVAPASLKPLMADVEKGAVPMADAAVWFVPSFNSRQRATLLNRSLAVLYTPVNEHFGIVPIEAMGAGRPVLTCDSGGPLESVLHGKTGFHCKPFAGDWAKAMQKMVQMGPKDLARMREAAYDQAQSFGIESFGDQLDSLVCMLGRKEIGADALTPGAAAQRDKKQK